MEVTFIHVERCYLCVCVCGGICNMLPGSRLRVRDMIWSGDKDTYHPALKFCMCAHT